MSRYRLDIVISHYKEPYSIVRPLIDMLSDQQNVNFDQFRVTLIHDGTDFFEELEGRELPFAFRELVIRHGGIAKVRNYGIDISDAEWIVFCDCDDSFSSVFSLKCLIDSLDDDRFDMLWGPYFVQDIENGDALGISKEFNLVWIHNKYYRLDFLKKHNVRFNESLEFVEDGGFNMLFYMEMEKGRIGEIKSDFPLYSWCRRPDSMTTTKNNVVKITENTIKRDIYVSDLFKSHGRPSYALMNGRTITDGYVLLSQKRLEPYPDDVLRMERRIKAFWEDNEENLLELTNAQWDFVLKASEREARESGALNPDRLTFAEWIKTKLRIERKLK